MQEKQFGRTVASTSTTLLRKGGKEMTQCIHEFAIDKADGQVKCVKCGDLDDEMELPNSALRKSEELDDFYKSQESFE